MSVTTPVLTTTSSAVRPTGSLRLATVVVGLAAAAATTVVAAAVHAAGVSLPATRRPEHSSSRPPSTRL